METFMKLYFILFMNKKGQYDNILHLFMRKRIFCNKLNYLINVDIHVTHSVLCKYNY